MKKWKNVTKGKQKLEKNIYSCVSEDLEKGNLEIIDELVNLFKKFNK